MRCHHWFNEYGTELLTPLLLPFVIKSSFCLLRFAITLKYANKEQQKNNTEKFDVICILCVFCI